MVTQRRATRRTSNNIRFPVIEEFSVNKYPLYPGKDGTGLHATLAGPITVIAGINGIGKTTLLNILLRVLIGPFDPKKADRLEPGGRLHGLVRLKKFGYFAARIGADAGTATATVKLKFGNDVLTITRSLGPQLQILALKHNNLVIERPDEDRYQEMIRDVSKTGERYDFDFVIRNLVFFMEDKVPLIWNPKGQFEILRILFLELALAEDCAKLYDKIFTLDSTYRNALWPLNSARHRLLGLVAEQEKIQPELADLPAHQARLDAAKESLLTDEKAWKQIVDASSQSETQAFVLDIQLQHHLNKISALESLYFSKAFPNINDVTQVTLGSLLDTEHCLACGNDSQRGKARLENLRQHHQCPICESEIEEPEDVHSLAHDYAASIRKERTAADEVRVRIRYLEEKKEVDEEELNRLEKNIAEARTIIQQLDHLVRRLTFGAASDSEEITNLRAQVTRDELELAKIKRDLDKTRREYGVLLAQAEGKIKSFANEIVDVFREYAGQFLLETCSLQYAMDKRTIGVSGAAMDFPSFELIMSSATIPQGSRRNSLEEVSESQKEFVDIAFRMALLEVASGASGGSMLIVETPEASLDSIYVDRAGEMLRVFANRPGVHRNSVIASSNLNKENMIPALLGLKKNRQGNVVYTAAAANSVINLLEIAKPTQSYTKNKRAYDEAFTAAIGVKR